MGQAYKEKPNISQGILFRLFDLQLKAKNAKFFLVPSWK
jgi:hypothetical protein